MKKAPGRKGKKTVKGITKPPLLRAPQRSGIGAVKRGTVKMAAHAATTCGTPPKEESHEGAAGAYKGRGWGEGDRSTRRPLAKLYKSDTPKAIDTGAEDTERGTQAMVQTRIGLERETRRHTHPRGADGSGLETGTAAEHVEEEAEQTRKRWAYLHGYTAMV